MLHCYCFLVVRDLAAGAGAGAGLPLPLLFEGDALVESKAA